MESPCLWYEILGHFPPPFQIQLCSDRQRSAFASARPTPDQALRREKNPQILARLARPYPRPPAPGPITLAAERIPAVPWRGGAEGS